MSQTFALYDHDAKEYIELGKDTASGFQLPDARIARFLRDRVKPARLTLIGDGGNTPDEEGGWRLLDEP